MAEEEVERRSVDVGALITKIDMVHTDVKELRTTLTDHIADEISEIATLIAAAMPHGDPLLHRRIHEEELELIKTKNDFWKKLLFELTKYGLFGLVSWLVYVVWTAFLHGPGK